MHPPRIVAASGSLVVRGTGLDVAVADTMASILASHPKAANVTARFLEHCECTEQFLPYPGRFGSDVPALRQEAPREEVAIGRVALFASGSLPKFDGLRIQRRLQAALHSGHSEARFRIIFYHNTGSEDWRASDCTAGWPLVSAKVLAHHLVGKLDFVRGATDLAVRPPGNGFALFALDNGDFDTLLATLTRLVPNGELRPSTMSHPLDCCLPSCTRAADDCN